MLVREANRTYEVPGDSEQIVRAAWLYHVAGNTQEQTADLLGISRVKVNRLLAEAREFGSSKSPSNIVLPEWWRSKRKLTAP